MINSFNEGEEMRVTEEGLGEKEEIPDESLELVDFVFFEHVLF